MTADRPASLDGLLAELAADLGEVEAVSPTPAETGEEAIDYRRAGRVFATRTGDQLEFRLNPEVAEAARRTPATSVSPRGSDWVRFTPPLLDRHALDRARAWFLSAWRAAVRPPGAER